MSPPPYSPKVFRAAPEFSKAATTALCAQLPEGNWHAAIGGPTLADAILDRLVHNAYRLELGGESMRRSKGIRGIGGGITDPTKTAKD